MGKDAAYFMKKALSQAEAAERRGEVPVGAVVVRGGEVIGRAGNSPINDRDPSAHAEIKALRRAGGKAGAYRLNGSVLYVTLEPCLMCYSAMVQARIARLVYGAADPKGGIFSTGAFQKIKRVYNHCIEVEAGVLPGPASDLLSNFFKARRRAGKKKKMGPDGKKVRTPA